MTSVNPVNNAVITNAALNHPAVLCIVSMASTSDCTKTMVYGGRSSEAMRPIGSKEY